MICKCENIEENPMRQRLSLRNIQAKPEKRELSQSKKSAHLGMKFINAIGLRNFVLNKFIFRPSTAKYNFVQVKEQNTKTLKFMINEKRQIQDIQGYDIEPIFIQQDNHSIPLLYIKSKHFICQQRPTIIYSHGNSSDISDGFPFIKKLVQTIQANIVIYDYTGYGISKINKISEQSLCEDLQLVIKWLNIPINRIIVWGFSLGTFPTITVSAKHKFGGVILHSPLASAACFLDSQIKQYCKKDNNHYTYDLDFLDSLQNIAKIVSPVIILHSVDDQIIPFSHAVQLYSIIKAQGKAESRIMIQVKKLRHNQMHYYIADKKQNVLNQHIRNFVKQVQHKIKQLNYIQNRHNKLMNSKKTIKINTQGSTNQIYALQTNQNQPIQKQGSLPTIQVGNQKKISNFRIKNESKLQLRRKNTILKRKTIKNLTPSKNLISFFQEIDN